MHCMVGCSLKIYIVWYFYMYTWRRLLWHTEVTCIHDGKGALIKQPEDAVI